MSNNYKTSKNKQYSGNSYVSNSNYSSNHTSGLYVINGQVKERKGICTCEKKGPCRGTCIST